MSKKVLIVFAGRKTNVPRIPMSSLVLAAYIRERGYFPEILDLRIDDDFKKIDFNQYLCVGIGSETGVALKSAISISKYIKEKYPKIPIIWGSYHASFLPKETLENYYVDCVVKGEGESALIDVLKDIEKDRIKGCYKKIYEEKEFLDMEKLPLAAYDIINIKKYSDAFEGIGYESSRGCPHPCNYCYAHSFHKSRWRHKSTEKVLKECEYLINKYGVKKFRFLEDNFFVNKERALNIAKGFIKKNFNIFWTATIRLDYLSNYSQEELKMLKKSGFWVAIVGAESGSQRILDYIEKGLTVKQIKIAIENCIKAGIMPQISFMAGFPTEKKEELLETLNLYDEIINLDKENIEVNSVFTLCPYPGTKIYNTLIKEYNHKTPKTLEEWSNWQFNNLKNVTWFNKSYKNYLHTMSMISRFKFFVHRIKFVNQEYIKKKFKLNFITKIFFDIFVGFYKLSAEIRWKKRAFNFAPEWWIYEKIRNFTTEIY